MKPVCLILVFIRQPSKGRPLITCAWAVDNKSPHLNAGYYTTKRLAGNF